MADAPESATADVPQPMMAPDGVILLGHRMLGQVTPDQITLNLGWCRMAGIAVTIEDDPKIDHHRGGIFLHRDPRRGA